ncbi:MAG: efflux RND transporter permease subunit, partial [Phycisphaerae bacterium]|nr:efflux RND transporter permease subunit [Phycisphaerae bacterium]
VGLELQINAKGRLLDPGEFGNVIIKTGPNGEKTLLKSVARVELGASGYSLRSLLNNKKAVAIPIFQSPGANALQLSTDVRNTMDELKRNFPDGLEYSVVYDPTVFVRSSIKAVVVTLFEAVLLVVIVVILFLQTWRASIIPLAAVPVSLIGTFAVMLALGFSINMLTLFGLVLAIGIVVDDAIVVVENVERNMMLHKLGAREATIRAMGEITGPIIAITLVLMSVFIPAAALPGITGQMYRQFALTIAASTALSAVCALTLSPALCALLLKSHESHAKPAWWTLPQRTLARWFNQFFDGLTALYAGFARLGAAAAPLSLAAFGLVLWWTFTGLSRVPTGFVPNEDLGFVMVAAQLPDGSSLERADAVLKRVSEECRKVDGVKDVTGLTGFSVLEGQGSVYANAWIVLDDWEERTKHHRDVETIMNDIRARVGPLQEAQFLVFGLPAISGLGNTSGFDIRIQDKQGLGRELQQQIVEELCGKAMTQSKIMFAFSGFRSGVPQLYLDIDREKAIKLGVSLPTVFQTLQTHLGSAYVNDFNLRGRTFQVSTQADHAFRVKPQDILRLEVRNERGQMVPIGTFTAVSDTLGPDRVTRYNMYTAAAINGIPAPGASSGEAMQVMEDIAKQSLPKGMGFEWTGLSYQERKAGSQGLMVFGLGLVLVYLILAAQYESWTTPLSVALSVPLVIIGAVLALQYRNFDNNVFTQIGLVLLVGLGAKNAILIVEFARENVARGMTPLDAAVDAAKTRFRPIIMTSLAFILGVTPLLTATGAGAASRQALGTAVFGGMIGQTILGLFFTPMLFVVVENVVGLFRRAKPATASHSAAPPAPPATPPGAHPTPA